MAGERIAELFEQHARMVYGVCRLILRDATEAEDAAQQTFLSAYRGLLAGQERCNLALLISNTIHIREEQQHFRFERRRTRDSQLIGVYIKNPALSIASHARKHRDIAVLRQQIEEPGIR